ncbi:major facilitator superfamily domain containing 7, isoform CRA_b [Mus musculus]|uniref:Uncharacterized protein n=1 Tax=Mus musculus TaxID=10090 RepID=Q8C260_MOUSE|nr:major facilitator superfamily domain containing 7, isoform CRA_b [Mus musculus]BAC40801.1 unnamed protein product [Mus musculus]
MAGTMDRLEDCNSPETSGTAGDALPSPRVYARRWVFLLVVSLLSCSNAMVQGCWVGRGGVFVAASAPARLFSCGHRKTTFLLAHQVVEEGANACPARCGAARETGVLGSRVSALQHVVFSNYP